MKCPLCEVEMSTRQETIGRSWFAGTYRCECHGVIRVSGRLLNDGARRVTHWIPSCQQHGFAAVTQTAQDRFRCMACDEEIRLIHGNLAHLKPVNLVSGRRSMVIV